METCLHPAPDLGRMYRFRLPGTTLIRLNVPLALLGSTLLVLALPQNPALWDALNRGLPSRLDPRVLVVGIDDATVRAYGAPDRWDRTLYARALTTLNEAGVQAVGLDVPLRGPAPGDEAVRQAVTSGAGGAGHPAG
ncbi:CHASE2 domain-containing protein [Deinococcus sonorensis]|uniref:CHASE2 domain-containing protein n=1 Tax=Deinococcus sonorensis KR-87 TaxID=694439 RepID=A0AAU7U898_9DEIO